MRKPMKDSPSTIMSLRDGRHFDLANPDPALIDFMDIATALSRQCRFNGHGRMFYSVAEHSVLVSLLVGKRFKQNNDLNRALSLQIELMALLHDAPEAYLGDITRPVQVVFADNIKGFTTSYHKLHDQLETMILTKMGVHVINDKQHEELATQARTMVAQADQQMLKIEQQALFTTPCDNQQPEIPINGRSPAKAEQIFLYHLGFLQDQLEETRDAS